MLFDVTNTRAARGALQAPGQGRNGRSGLRALAAVIALVSLGALGGVAGGCDKRIPIRTPPLLTAASTPQMTELAILDALPHRGWTAEEVRPGRIVAFLSVRDHLLRLAIRYDEKVIQLNYLSSDNLGYTQRDQVGYVHRAWMTWTRKLAADIERSVRKREKQAASDAAFAPLGSSGSELEGPVEPPASEGPGATPPAPPTPPTPPTN